MNFRISLSIVLLSHSVQLAGADVALSNSGMERAAASNGAPTSSNQSSPDGWLSTQIAGWSVSSTDGYSPAEGADFWLGSVSSTDTSDISNSITGLEAGQTYLLEFSAASIAAGVDISGNTTNSEVPQVAFILTDQSDFTGGVTVFESLSGGSGLASPNWESFSYQFTAAPGQDTAYLLFGAPDLAPGSSGLFAVDNVSVTPVPEPGSAVLSFLAVVLLGRRRR
ncbi:MAG: hypothetical protein ACSHYF_03805 [Verrucomicrobiaceae bacterium]